MKLTAVSLLLIAFMSWSLPCHVLANDSPEPFQPRTPIEFEQMAERIDASYTSKDILKMESLAKEIQIQWSKADTDQYSELMARICHAFLFSGFAKPSQESILAEKYALLALKRKDDLPALTEADLVSDLLPQEDRFLSEKTLKDKDWASYRIARASISLHALGRIAKATDRNFDFSKLPIDARPPLGANGIGTGMSPELITDPKVRADYEARIKASEVINAKYQEQYQLKLMTGTLVPQEERYIVDLYSIQPYNGQELKRLLDTYLSDPGMKQRIMDKVTNNTVPAK